MAAVTYRCEGGGETALGTDDALPDGWVYVRVGRSFARSQYGTLLVKVLVCPSHRVGAYQDAEVVAGP